MAPIYVIGVSVFFFLVQLYAGVHLNKKKNRLLKSYSAGKLRTRLFRFQITGILLVSTCVSVSVVSAFSNSQYYLLPLEVSDPLNFMYTGSILYKMSVVWIICCSMFILKKMDEYSLQEYAQRAHKIECLFYAGTAMHATALFCIMPSWVTLVLAVCAIALCVLSNFLVKKQVNTLTLQAE